MMKRAALLVFLFLSSLHDADAKQSNLRRLSNDMGEPCTLLLKEIQYDDSSESFEWECEVTSADTEEGHGGEIIPLNGVAFAHYDNILQDGTLVESSETLLLPVGASIADGSISFKQRPKFSDNVKGKKDKKEKREKRDKSDKKRFGQRNRPKGKSNKHRELATNDYQGVRKVLVVHVTAADAENSFDAAELSNSVFGTNGDAFNLAQGYKDCSHEKLTFIPYEGDNVSNGVYKVTISSTVANTASSTLVNIIRTQLETDLQVDDLQDIGADHVMLCIPPGSSGGGWIAYAYIGHWLSVYNDAWCTKPSAQIHEIGHNLRLAHSGESSAYGDQTGMMGYSYNQDEGPIMCFNNAKNWQLGWYADQSATINPLTGSWTGDVIGVNDYRASDKTVVVKVEGSATGLDYYIGFNSNKQQGINSGTREAPNLVTIQSKTGTGYATSKLEAKLNAGEEFVIDNFSSNGPVTIVVTSIDLDATVPYAEVTVRGSTCEVDADCNTNDPCMDDNCVTVAGGQKQCTSVPNASCEGEIEVLLRTDKWPGETSWEITDECNSDAILLQSETYSAKNTWHNQTLENASNKKLRFTIRDAYGDGICCTYGEGELKINLNGETVHESKFDGGSEESNLFGATSCNNGPNPPPNSPPTPPPNPSPTPPPNPPPTPPPTSNPTPQPTPQPTASPTKPPISLEELRDKVEQIEEDVQELQNTEESGI